MKLFLIIKKWVELLEKFRLERIKELKDLQDLLVLGTVLGFVLEWSFVVVYYFFWNFSVFGV